MGGLVFIFAGDIDFASYYWIWELFRQCVGFFLSFYWLLFLQGKEQYKQCLFLDIMIHPSIFIYIRYGICILPVGVVLLPGYLLVNVLREFFYFDFNLWSYAVWGFFLSYNQYIRCTITCVYNKSIQNMCV